MKKCLCCTFTAADGRIRHDSEGHQFPNKGGPGCVSDAPSSLPASLVGSVPGQFTGGKKKKKELAVLTHAAVPFRPTWDCFIPLVFFPTYSSSPRSHDRLPLLLHHRRGFLVLAGPLLSRVLLIGDVQLLAGQRHRVLRDRAVLHVAGEVPVAVDRHRPQPRGEVEGQRRPGSNVGDAGVRHHRSVAVRVTAASSFPLEVQRQCPPAPGLFDLSLHLESQTS